MRKTLLAVAALLLTLTACNKKNDDNKGTQPAPHVKVVRTDSLGNGVSSQYAYVKVDSISMVCDFFKTDGVALQSKTEKKQREWATKQQNIQNEFTQLQNKYERGLITSRDAQTEQESIQKRAATLESSLQKEAATLEEENMVFMNRLADYLRRSVQTVNADKRYALVFNASALIDADSALDISEDVLVKMNELYAQDKK